MGASTKGKSDPHALFSPGEGKGGNETGKGMDYRGIESPKVSESLKYNTYFSSLSPSYVYLVHWRLLYIAEPHVT